MQVPHRVSPRSARSRERRAESARDKGRRRQSGRRRSRGAVIKRYRLGEALKLAGWAGARKAHARGGGANAASVKICYIKACSSHGMSSVCDGLCACQRRLRLTSEHCLVLPPMGETTGCARGTLRAHAVFEGCLLRARPRASSLCLQRSRSRAGAARMPAECAEHGARDGDDDQEGGEAILAAHGRSAARRTARARAPARGREWHAASTSASALSPSHAPSPLAFARPQMWRTPPCAPHSALGSRHVAQHGATPHCAAPRDHPAFARAHSTLVPSPRTPRPLLHAASPRAVCHPAAGRQARAAPPLPTHPPHHSCHLAAHSNAYPRFPPRAEFRRATGPPKCTHFYHQNVRL